MASIILETAPDLHMQILWLRKVRRIMQQTDTVPQLVCQKRYLDSGTKDNHLVKKPDQNHRTLCNVDLHMYLHYTMSIRDTVTS